MSYTLNLATGSVTRDSDGKQVAPAQTVDDPDYVAYVEWCNAGNQPSEISIAPPNEPRKITVLAFRNRFHMAEKVALELMSLDDKTAPFQARQIAASLRVYAKDSDNAKFIDLERQDTQYGLYQLVALGILDMSRADEIIHNQVQPEERWEP
jgi:hypothetical protein